MKKKIYLLKYSHSYNIGDNIQSFVAKIILEKNGYQVGFIDQKSLAKIKKEVILLVNGFFCYEDNNFGNQFPFSNSIYPIFWNFHLELDYGKKEKVEKQFFTKKNISYLKKYAPIGCRDEETKNIFLKYGIDAFNNNCLTLLLDKRREIEEKNADKVIIVDCDEFVPKPKNEKILYITHSIANGNYYSNDTKMNISENILSFYRKNAKLVITSRFHCAMPCLAMGIPVIYMGYENYRTQQEFIKMYPYIHFGKKYIGSLRKFGKSNTIPVLGTNIKYSFNIIDILYGIVYKIYLNILYKLGFKKINWNPEIYNLETMKKEKINLLLEKLKGI